MKQRYFKRRKNRGTGCPGIKSVNTWYDQLRFFHLTWWRHQMGKFSASLALCAGNSPGTGKFPSQRPVTRSFGVFFDLNKRLSNQSWGWWFETLSRPLWRHCNENGGEALKIYRGGGLVTLILKIVQVSTKRALHSASCWQVSLGHAIVRTSQTSKCTLCIAVGWESWPVLISQNVKWTP